MIKSLSPYNLEIPFVAPISGLTCTSYTLQIFVWSGVKSDPPTTATYEITKDNPTASTGSDEVNIALLVNDFIDFTAYDRTTTGLVDGNNQYWVKTQVLYTTADVDDYVPNYVSILLMTAGYGYGMDGENSQIPANNILMTGTEFKVSRDGFFIFPFLVTEPVFFVNILSYSYNSSGETSSDVDIVYSIIDFTPDDVVIQTSADDITFADQETRTNVSPLENVIITYPSGGSTYVRLKITVLSVDYFSDSINIGLE